MTARQGAGAQRSGRSMLAVGLPFGIVAFGIALFVIGAVVGAGETAPRTPTRAADIAPAPAIAQSMLESTAAVVPGRDVEPRSVVAAAPRSGAHGAAGPLATGDETLRLRDGAWTAAVDPAVAAAIAELEMLHDPALMGALSGTAFTAGGPAWNEPDRYEVLIEPWMLQAYGHARYTEAMDSR